MTADPRAVLALDTHLAYMRQMTLASGGEVVERDGALVLRSRHGLPFLVNLVARVDPAAAPDRVLDVARGVFGDSGHEVVALQDRDGDLVEAAVARGMHRSTAAEPLQYLEGRPQPNPVATGDIDVRVVSDAAGAADIVEIAIDAHLVYDFPEDFFPTILGRPETVLAPNVVPFVAYRDGTPVATAQLVMFGDIAYVGWVAVIRAAARQGLGWLVTERVVNAGLERGARATVLMASPMGIALYRKMGFVDVGAVHGAYADPAPSF